VLRSTRPLYLSSFPIAVACYELGTSLVLLWDSTGWPFVGRGKKLRKIGISKSRLFGRGSTPRFGRVIAVFVLAWWRHPRINGYKIPYFINVEAPERSYPSVLRLPLLSFTLAEVRSKPPVREYGVKHGNNSWKEEGESKDLLARGKWRAALHVLLYLSADGIENRG